MSEFRPTGDFDKYREAHRASDVDADRTSLHHTLGKGSTQSAPGNHKHDDVYAALEHEHAIADVIGLTAQLGLVIQDGDPAGGDLTGTYPNPTLVPITDAKVAAANKDGAAGTPSMRTLGTGAAQAAAGNHKHANTYQEAMCTATVTSTTTAYTNITGASITLASNGVADEFEIIGIFDVTQNGTTTLWLGGLSVDGAAPLTESAVFQSPTANMRVTVAQTWKITGLAAGNHTFQLQHRLLAASASGYSTNQPRTKITGKKVTPLG